MKKIQGKGKKTTLVVSMVVLGIVLAIAIAATAYAIWQANPDETVGYEMIIDKKNPSLKYQMFVPLDATGERIAGTYNPKNKEFTLQNAGDMSSIVSLSFVGYDGGVAVSHLEVPETCKYKVNGTEKELPVTKISVFPEFAEYKMRENPVITEITIPNNVIYIASGAFLGMQNLKKVNFVGESPIFIENYAFAQCPQISDNLGARMLDESCDITKIFTRG